MDETHHALAPSDSEDSDMSDLDISESDLRLIMELETRLETNAHDYDAHVALIDVLRRCHLLERLREARRAMHARFPMAPTLWMDWISDELQAVTQEEDIAKIRQLLEDAHEDYMSVDLWLKHLE
jgi:squamous cell carcinoma antigen recognized by T-cells 3